MSLYFIHIDNLFFRLLLRVLCSDPDIGPYFVGVGGMPNAAGVHELDAAVMDGRACQFGAVLSLQSYVATARYAVV